MNEKQMKILGWVDLYVCMMYVSYFPQIMDNLMGHKGTLFNPLSWPSTVAFRFTTDSSKKNAIFHLQPMHQGSSLVWSQPSQPL